MVVQCTHGCGRHFNDATRSTVCPHNELGGPGMTYHSGDADFGKRPLARPRFDLGKWILWTIGLVCLALAIFAFSKSAKGDAPPMVRIFTEDPLAEPATDLSRAMLTPYAVWHGEYWGNASTLYANQEDRLAADLASRPPGFKGVKLGWILVVGLDWTQGPHTYLGATTKPDLLSIWRNGRGDLTIDANRLRPFAKSLTTRSVQIDALYTDCEMGFGWWNTGAAGASSVVKDRGARLKMPADLLVWTDAPTNNGDREFITKFNKAGDDIRRSEIRRLFSIVGFPMNPAAPVFNFYDTAQSFTTFDTNGWPIASDTIDGRTSCIPTYLSTGAFRYPPVAVRRCHPLWNSFIDGLNAIRSANNAGTVVPIVNVPADGSVTNKPAVLWLNDQLVGHYFRMGAITLQFFNPKPVQTVADENSIALAVAHHYRWANYERQTLPEIPLDSMSVTTGSLTTTYADFCAASRINPADSYQYADGSGYTRKP